MTAAHRMWHDVPRFRPGWRNGIRGRLKPVWSKDRRGSTPLPGTEGSRGCEAPPAWIPRRSGPKTRNGLVPAPARCPPEESRILALRLDAVHPQRVRLAGDTHRRTRDDDDPFTDLDHLPLGEEAVHGLHHVLLVVELRSHVGVHAPRQSHDLTGRLLWAEHQHRDRVSHPGQPPRGVAGLGEVSMKNKTPFFTITFPSCKSSKIIPNSSFI